MTEEKKLLKILIALALICIFSLLFLDARNKKIYQCKYNGYFETYRWRSEENETDMENDTHCYVDKKYSTFNRRPPKQ